LNNHFRSAAAVALLTLIGTCAARSGLKTPLEESLASLSTVDKEGQGHAAAQQAMRCLSTAKAADLPAILTALDRASPLGANWIRNAFETVSDRELRQKHPLPVHQLEKFVRDRSHQPRARRLAYELLVKVDPSTPDRLIPGMLLDPAPEFRRDAVALKIAEAAKVDPKLDKPQAVRLYRQALSGAIHDDQVKTIAAALEKLGQKVNITEHFAFLTRFSVIGPFDNHDGKLLETVYPPETEIRLDAQYDGKLGMVSWQPLATTNDYGIVDIAKQVHPYKGATMYLLAEFHSPQERPIELRLATQNAWKIWLNEKLLFARNEYHRGSVFDQYRLPAQMRAGRNTILLKICQDEEKEDWAQSYQFQLRVCDSNGSGIRSQPISVSGGQR
jgi:hypothetical protein